MADDHSSAWIARAAERWGHYAPELLMVTIVAVIYLGVRPVHSPIAVATVLTALLTVLLGSWVLMRRHDRSLCEHCVAGLPLNASEQATKYHARFWVVHSATQPHLLLPYFAVLVGSNFVPGPVGRLVWAAVQTSMIYLIVSHTTHRRLQPWCPWCQGGDGGDGRDPVTPDPDPRRRRQLV